MNDHEIMKEFEEELASRLKARTVKIDDIEHLMGEAIDGFRDELACRAREIIERSDLAADIKDCPDCGTGLKKTR